MEAQREAQTQRRHRSEIEEDKGKIKETKGDTKGGTTGDIRKTKMENHGRQTQDKRMTCS